MEVARGWVVPTQTELCSQPVMEHNVVVHIDYVHPEHEDRPLSQPPSPEERPDCDIKGALFSKVIKTSTAYELQKQSKGLCDRR